MDQQQPQTSLERAASATIRRRALLKASWIVPAILVVGIPKNALAQSGSDVVVDPCDLSPDNCSV